MRADPQVVPGEGRPHLVGIGARIPQHAHLEQRPRHVEDDAAVTPAEPFGERHRVVQPALLPCRLVHVERDDVGDRLGEGIAVGPVAERGARADGGEMDGVPGLVQQLVQVVEAAGTVGREHPRLDHRLARAEGGECHRVLPLARLEVEVHAQPLHIGAEGPEHLRIEHRQPGQRDSGAQLPAGAPILVDPIPRLDQRVGRRVAPGAEHGQEPRLQRVRRDTRRPSLGRSRGFGVWPGAAPPSRSAGDRGCRARCLRSCCARRARARETALAAGRRRRCCRWSRGSSADRACRLRTERGIAPSRSRRRCALAGIDAAHRVGGTVGAGGGDDRRPRVGGRDRQQVAKRHPAHLRERSNVIARERRRVDRGEHPVQPVTGLVGARGELVERRPVLGRRSAGGDGDLVAISGVACERERRLRRGERHDRARGSRRRRSRRAAREPCEQQRRRSGRASDRS